MAFCDDRRLKIDNGTQYEVMKLNSSRTLFLSIAIIHYMERV